MKDTQDNLAAQNIRLDKWLWAARFYKTRALSQKSIRLGKVRYNGQKATASRIVQIGAEITLEQGNIQKTVIVHALSDVRGPYSQAQKLYEETKQSLEAREKQIEKRKLNQINRTSPKPAKSPDKKSREALRKLRRES